MRELAEEQLLFLTQKKQFEVAMTIRKDQVAEKKREVQQEKEQNDI